MKARHFLLLLSIPLLILGLVTQKESLKNYVSTYRALGSTLGTVFKSRMRSSNGIDQSVNLAVDMSIYGEELTISLSRSTIYDPMNHSLPIDSDFDFQYYTGTVANRPNSTVFLSISWVRNILSGTIDFGNGTVVHLDTIEKGRIVYYLNDDVTYEGSCANEDDEVHYAGVSPYDIQDELVAPGAADPTIVNMPFPANPGSRSKSLAYTGVCSVAIIADLSFANRWGSDTASVVLSVINGVNAVYQAQLGVSLSVNYMHIVTSDENNIFTGSNPDMLNYLSGIANFLASPYPDLNMNNYCLVHVFTHTPYTGLLGKAYVGSVCQHSRYSVGLSTASYDGKTVLQTQFISTVAHEMGHGFGSYHDPFGTTCDPTYKYIMATYAQAPGVNTLTFSSCSKSYISNTLKSGQNSCLNAFKNTSFTTWTNYTLNKWAPYPDDQCRSYFDTGDLPAASAGAYWTDCLSFLDPSLNCTLVCTDSNSPNLQCTEFPTLTGGIYYKFDGTPCNPYLPGYVCINGQCQADNRDQTTLCNSTKNLCCDPYGNPRLTRSICRTVSSEVIAASLGCRTQTDICLSSPTTVCNPRYKAPGTDCACTGWFGATCNGTCGQGKTLGLCLSNTDSSILGGVSGDSLTTCDATCYNPGETCVFVSGVPTCVTISPSSCNLRCANPAFEGSAYTCSCLPGCTNCCSDYSLYCQPTKGLFTLSGILQRLLLIYVEYKWYVIGTGIGILLLAAYGIRRCMIIRKRKKAGQFY